MSNEINSQTAGEKNRLMLFKNFFEKDCKKVIFGKIFTKIGLRGKLFSKDHIKNAPK